MEKAEKQQYFKDIYEKEADRVFRFVLLRVSRREETKDIVQEVFYKFWQMIEEGKEVNHHQSLLFTMARNKVIDWYRKKKPESLSSIEDVFLEEDEELQIIDPEAHEDIVLSTEARDALRHLNKLPPQYAEAIRLRFVEDLSPSEIAEYLNISANAASLRVNHALEKLRDIMNIKDE